MKKLLLFLLCLLSVTVIMAQTDKTAINKESTTETTYQDILPGYNGPTKCDNPMSSDEFTKLLTDIKANGTDSKMLSFAKLEIRDKCLLASQVEKIMLVFMFDTNRSAFLVFARKYTYDQDNYYALRLRYPKEKVNCPKENVKAFSGQVNTHNELHGNWERTNQANVVYVNWLQSSYGSGPYDEINR